MRQVTSVRDITGVREPRLRARDTAAPAEERETPGHWIILPYDGSPLARAALRHAAGAVRQGGRPGRYAGVVLATTAAEPAGLAGVADDARAQVGRDVPLAVRLLDPGEPRASFERIAASMPGSITAVPIGGRGWASWYADACRLGDAPNTTMLFLIRRDELRTIERARHSGRIGTAVAALGQARVRFALYLRTLFAGKVNGRRVARAADAEGGPAREYRTTTGQPGGGL